MSTRWNPDMKHPCPRCRGWGFLPGSKDPDTEIDCPACDGKGAMQVNERTAPMTDKRLIEEARRAKTAVYLATDASVADDLSRIIGGLIDALEAAEKAHTPTTPTNDERKAIAQVIIPTFDQLASSVYGDGPYSGAESALEAADLLIAAGFRRSEVPEPRSCGEVHPTIAHLLPHAWPHGEPSGHAVSAFLRELGKERGSDGGYIDDDSANHIVIDGIWTSDDIRAALRAAFEAGGEGR